MQPMPLEEGPLGGGEEEGCDVPGPLRSIIGGTPRGLQFPGLLSDTLGPGDLGGGDLGTVSPCPHTPCPRHQVFRAVPPLKPPQGRLVALYRELAESYVPWWVASRGCYDCYVSLLMMELKDFYSIYVYLNINRIASNKSYTIFNFLIQLHKTP